MKRLERSAPDPAAVRAAWEAVAAELRRRSAGRAWWAGRLSDSALAGATAVVALALAAEAFHERAERFRRRAARGAEWIAAHRNPDGAWGDTPESRSNPTTTLLVLAALRCAGFPPDDPRLARAAAWLEAAGGLQTLVAGYGADRTFAAPIVALAAAAGLARWEECPELPFWLAALPRWSLRFLGLPVVSYALPALIAVGLARFANAPPAGRLARWTGNLARGPALAALARIVPASGGFLEAVPLTSFVLLSLLSAGLRAHPALEPGLAFLERTQRPDGAWPVDSDLSVWVTTLATQALGGGEPATREWLLERQGRRVHPFTGAAPGGWPWTHRPGGVPDADDTAGALLALGLLPRGRGTLPAVRSGLGWLLGLQNRDGGLPTFCRGWGRLPFDRSSPDLTAHFLRAANLWRAECPGRLGRRLDRARAAALAYLEGAQRPSGAWHPLWFGSEAAAGQAAPVLGAGRVLLALGECGLGDSPMAVRGSAFLAAAQNPDGGWGGERGLESSLEESAAALEGLLAANAAEPARRAGLAWLCARVAERAWDRPRPIGLYFASLWYSEELYPLAWAGAALRRALAGAPGTCQTGETPALAAGLVEEL